METDLFMQKYITKNFRGILMSPPEIRKMLEQASRMRCFFGAEKWRFGIEKV